MNQGRIWCVVNPTVGLPLFLGAVALIAFVVHFAILNNTDWFPAYWGGDRPLGLEPTIDGVGQHVPAPFVEPQRVTTPSRGSFAR